VKVDVVVYHLVTTSQFGINKSISLAKKFVLKIVWSGRIYFFLSVICQVAALFGGLIILLLWMFIKK